MALPTPAPDRTAIVTGASAGIGVELATQLAAKGHGVTLVARREDRLKTLADELSTKYGVRAEVIAADLVDRQQRAGMLDTVAERGLTVDLLINNAGFSTLGRVADSDPDREIMMLQLNVEAVAHLCSLVVPGMVERGRGAILNVASTASYQPMPGQAGYAASKSFVRSYTEALGVELRGTGVVATALCPGPVDTEFAEVAGFESSVDEMDATVKAMLVDADEVARVGLDALANGKLVAIPGRVNQVLAGFATVVPNRLLAPLMAKQHPLFKD